MRIFDYYKLGIYFYIGCILGIIINNSCSEKISGYNSIITVKLQNSSRVESWRFRFVKVDTILNPVKVGSKFKVSFTQEDTLVIPDSTQITFAAGIDTIETIIMKDSVNMIENEVIVKYQNEGFTNGIWYLTISTKFNDLTIESPWSKPVWFRIINKMDNKYKNDISHETYQ